jgi:5-methylcytosine-specific restriction endonuclease McrA
MSRVLVLTPSYVPHKVISWERAVIMYFSGKVDVLDSYDEELRSPSTVLKMPAVVKLKWHPAGVKRSVKFSRVNVFTRDDHRCQYCGSPKRMSELNYDHVVPRHVGGRTVWENIVACCYPCNARKKNRTPEQAGMKLLRKPYVPKTLPFATPRFDPREIPTVWADYVRAFFKDDAAA